MSSPEPSELRRLYFVRHGESQANLEHVFSNRDLPHGLTQAGRAQVERLAEQLTGIPFTGFYVSPVQRALESACILAARLGLAYISTAALAEFDMGVLEGRSDAASWCRYEALLDAWLRKGERQTRIEGGESFDDVRARFVPLIDGLLSAPQAGPVLLVGHGGTFICMLPLVLSNVSAEFARERSIQHTEVVIAEVRADRLTCLAWGDTKLADT